MSSMRLAMAAMRVCAFAPKRVAGAPKRVMTADAAQLAGYAVDRPQRIRHDF